jgi:pyrroline-5-carboxylate reductase
MKKTVAFIGTGNMGSAMIRAACQAISPAQVYVTDNNQEKAASLAEQFECHLIKSNEAAVQTCDYIFLCVKPQVMNQVLHQINPILCQRAAAGQAPVLISIAAGIQIKTLKEQLGKPGEGITVARIMPNTPVAIGQGMLAVALEDTAAPAILTDIQTILKLAGRVEVLPEYLMDQFTAVAGCSPAFVYMFIEALADGAVLTGLPREQALTFAAQTVQGAAAMVLETGAHPGVLKDAVCSPGGSTIAGVGALEQNGFRYAAIEAVQKSYLRNGELGA